ncbi:MAG: glycosyltransferase [Candidatus Gastranaerophilales bacterium]|nr:glycosyltransferase [Candidatus Gastranaerophilales bacterium]
MREKVALIAHSYHRKTRSCDFFADLLQEFYDVELLFDEEWETGKKINWEALNNDYKAVVIFQMFPDEGNIKKITNKNIVYLPMYDHVEKWHFNKWYLCKDIKIVSFSLTLHRKLKKIGFNSIYVQYFPEPKEFSPGNSNEVFLWQRFTNININTVKKLFKNKDIKLHIHKVPDPGKLFVTPYKEDEKNLQITYSNWFEDKEDLINLIKNKGIYIAPRYTEGIGMSFLEAMAMGKLVIANNKPTMNEYIKNGETGILCNFNFPQPVKISDIEQIQRNTFEFMQKGYQKWLTEKKNIINFIQEEPKHLKLSFYKKIILPFLLFDIKKIIRFKLGTNPSLTIFGIKLCK